MADVLGTVLGVVSLGLQVGASISNYLDGVQCRKEDMEYTTRCCKSMNSLLQQIKSLQYQLTGVNITAVREAMTTAEVELSILGNFVEKIRAGNNANSPNPVMKRAKKQKTKLLYPFQKDHLYRLNAQLDAANRALQAALLQVQLKLSIAHGEELQGLKIGLDSLSRGVSQMHLAVQPSAQKKYSNGMILNSTLNNIEKKTANLPVASSQQETTLVLEDLKELKMMLTSLMSSCSDGRAVLPRLISKPAVLKNFCDVAEVDSGNAAADAANDSDRPFSRSRSYPGFQCTCKPRQVCRQRRQRIGLAFWEQESLIGNVHASWCSFASVCTTLNDTWSIGISTSTLKAILPAAITFSMSATFGAGGFGISPSFTYYPVRQKSPALNVIRLLEDAFFHREWSEEECSGLIQCGLKTLQATFMAKTSSPLEIDNYGCSLLGAMSRIAANRTWQGYRNRVFAFLVDAGVPRDRPDQHGSYPFHLYIYLSSTPLDTLAQNVGALDILLPDDSVTPLILQDAKMPPQNCDAEAMQAFRRASAISLKMRKAYEGHLMGAIVRQNKTMLLDSLKKDTNMSELSEMDPFGQKMLNYLVGWPEGLQIMVEHYGLASLQLLDQSQSTLLSSALSWSGKTCIGYSPQGCSDDCPCANAVDLLVKAGKHSSLQFNLHDNWVNAMLGASAKARDLIIDELKIRREELKHLGLMHLTCDQIDRMDLKKKTVLDYYTRQVLEALDAKGVNVHPRCRTDLHATEWHLGVTSNEPSDKIWRKGASVYHILGYAKISGYSIGACELADSLYAKGFGDIDLPDINEHDDEEILEILEEDEGDLESFEVLMVELDRRWEELGCSLAEFYRLHWIDRMDEVLRQMDERMLTAEEIQNVKKLGIDLAVRPEPFTREKGSYENKGSVEYWCQRMDALVA
uniref:Fungal N-terminal domain-containing protein n=1 Tax=Colletotrichum fructicola (strain Nara gc5) TaxID=1213859 RepID=L2FY61_COLFN